MPKAIAQQVRNKDIRNISRDRTKEINKIATNLDLFHGHI